MEAHHPGGAPSLLPPPPPPPYGVSAGAMLPPYSATPSVPSYDSTVGGGKPSIMSGAEALDLVTVRWALRTRERFHNRHLQSASNAMPSAGFHDTQSIGLHLHQAVECGLMGLSTVEGFATITNFFETLWMELVASQAMPLRTLCSTTLAGSTLGYHLSLMELVLAHWDSIPPASAQQPQPTGIAWAATTIMSVLKLCLTIATIAAREIRSQAAASGFSWDQLLDETTSIFVTRILPVCSKSMMVLDRLLVAKSWFSRDAAASEGGGATVSPPTPPPTKDTKAQGGWSVTAGHAEERSAKDESNDKTHYESEVIQKAEVPQRHQPHPLTRAELKKCVVDMFFGEAGLEERRNTWHQVVEMLLEIPIRDSIPAGFTMFVERYLSCGLSLGTCLASDAASAASKLPSLIECNTMLARLHVPSMESMSTAPLCHFQQRVLLVASLAQHLNETTPSHLWVRAAGAITSNDWKRAALRYVEKLLSTFKGRSGDIDDESLTVRQIIAGHMTTFLNVVANFIRMVAESGVSPSETQYIVEGVMASLTHVWRFLFHTMQGAGDEGLKDKSSSHGTSKLAEMVKECMVHLRRACASTPSEAATCVDPVSHLLSRLWDVLFRLPSSPRHRVSYGGVAVGTFLALSRAFRGNASMSRGESFAASTPSEDRVLELSFTKSLFETPHRSQHFSSAIAPAASDPSSKTNGRAQANHAVPPVSSLLAWLSGPPCLPQDEAALERLESDGLNSMHAHLRGLASLAKGEPLRALCTGMEVCAQLTEAARSRTGGSGSGLRRPERICNLLRTVSATLLRILEDNNFDEDSVLCPARHDVAEIWHDPNFVVDVVKMIWSSSISNRGRTSYNTSSASTSNTKHGDGDDSDALSLDNALYLAHDATQTLEHGLAILCLCPPNVFAIQRSTAASKDPQRNRSAASARQLAAIITEALTSSSPRLQLLACRIDNSQSMELSTGSNGLLSSSQLTQSQTWISHGTARHLTCDSVYRAIGKLLEMDAASPSNEDAARGSGSKKLRREDTKAAPPARRMHHAPRRDEDDIAPLLAVAAAASKGCCEFESSDCQAPLRIDFERHLEAVLCGSKATQKRPSAKSPPSDQVSDIVLARVLSHEILRSRGGDREATGLSRDEGARSSNRKESGRSSRFGSNGSEGPVSSTALLEAMLRFAQSFASLTALESDCVAADCSDRNNSVDWIKRLSQLRLAASVLMALSTLDRAVVSFAAASAVSPNLLPPQWISETSLQIISRSLPGYRLTLCEAALRVATSLSHHASTGSVTLSNAMRNVVEELHALSFRSNLQSLGDVRQSLQNAIATDRAQSATLSKRSAFDECVRGRLRLWRETWTTSLHSVLLAFRTDCEGQCSGHLDGVAALLQRITPEIFKIPLVAASQQSDAPPPVSRSRKGGAANEDRASLVYERAEYLARVGVSLASVTEEILSLPSTAMPTMRGSAPSLRSTRRLDRIPSSIRAILSVVSIVNQDPTDHPREATEAAEGYIERVPALILAMSEPLCQKVVILSLCCALHHCCANEWEAIDAFDNLRRLLTSLFDMYVKDPKLRERREALHAMKVITPDDHLQSLRNFIRLLPKWASVDAASLLPTSAEPSIAGCVFREPHNRRAVRFVLRKGFLWVSAAMAQCFITAARRRRVIGSLLTSRNTDEVEVDNTATMGLDNDDGAVPELFRAVAEGVLSDADDDNDELAVDPLSPHRASQRPAPAKTATKPATVDPTWWERLHQFSEQVNDAGAFLGFAERLAAKIPTLLEKGRQQLSNRCVMDTLSMLTESADVGVLERRLETLLQTSQGSHMLAAVAARLSLASRISLLHRLCPNSGGDPAKVRSDAPGVAEIFRHNIDEQVADIESVLTNDGTLKESAPEDSSAFALVLVDWTRCCLFMSTESDRERRDSILSRLVSIWNGESSMSTDTPLNPSVCYALQWLRNVVSRLLPMTSSDPSVEAARVVALRHVAAFVLQALHALPEAQLCDAMRVCCDVVTCDPSATYISNGERAHWAARVILRISDIGGSLAKSACDVVAESIRTNPAMWISDLSLHIAGASLLHVKSSLSADDDCESLPIVGLLRSLITSPLTDAALRAKCPNAWADWVGQGALHSCVNSLTVDAPDTGASATKEATEFLNALKTLTFSAAEVMLVAAKHVFQMLEWCRSLLADMISEIGDEVSSVPVGSASTSTAASMTALPQLGDVESHRNGRWQRKAGSQPSRSQHPATQQTVIRGSAVAATNDAILLLEHLRTAIAETADGAIDVMNTRTSNRQMTWFDTLVWHRSQSALGRLQAVQLPSVDPRNTDGPAYRGWTQITRLLSQLIEGLKSSHARSPYDDDDEPADMSPHRRTAMINEMRRTEAALTAEGFPVVQQLMRELVQIHEQALSVFFGLRTDTSDACPEPKTLLDLYDGGAVPDIFLQPVPPSMLPAPKAASLPNPSNKCGAWYLDVNFFASVPYHPSGRGIRFVWKATSATSSSERQTSKKRSKGAKSKAHSAEHSDHSVVAFDETSPTPPSAYRYFALKSPSTLPSHKHIFAQDAVLRERTVSILWSSLPSIQEDPTALVELAVDKRSALRQSLHAAHCLRRPSKSSSWSPVIFSFPGGGGMVEQPQECVSVASLVDGWREKRKRVSDRDDPRGAHVPLSTRPPQVQFHETLREVMDESRAAAGDTSRRSVAGQAHNHNTSPTPDMLKETLLRLLRLEPSPRDTVQFALFHAPAVSGDSDAPTSSNEPSSRDQHRHYRITQEQQQQAKSLTTTQWVSAPNARLWCGWNFMATDLQYINKWTRMVTSCAVGSGMTFVLGVGDRNLANLYLNLETGDCIHSEFAIAFFDGLKNRHHPERVPFRLSPVLMRPFGPYGCEGGFARSLQGFVSAARDNELLVADMVRCFVSLPMKLDVLQASKRHHHNHSLPGGTTASQQWLHDQVHSRHSPFRRIQRDDVSRIAESLSAKLVTFLKSLVECVPGAKASRALQMRTACLTASKVAAVIQGGRKLKQLRLEQASDRSEAQIERDIAAVEALMQRTDRESQDAVKRLQSISDQADALLERVADTISDGKELAARSLEPDHIASMSQILRGRSSSGILTYGDTNWRNDQTLCAVRQIVVNTDRLPRQLRLSCAPPVKDTTTMHADPMTALCGALEVSAESELGDATSSLWRGDTETLDTSGWSRTESVPPHVVRTLKPCAMPFRTLPVHVGAPSSPASSWAASSTTALRCCHNVCKVEQMGRCILTACQQLIAEHSGVLPVLSAEPAYPTKHLIEILRQQADAGSFTNEATDSSMSDLVAVGGRLLREWRTVRMGLRPNDDDGIHSSFDEALFEWVGKRDDRIKDSWSRASSLSLFANLNLTGNEGSKGDTAPQSTIEVLAVAQAWFVAIGEAAPANDSSTWIETVASRFGYWIAKAAESVGVTVDASLVAARALSLVRTYVSLRRGAEVERSAAVNFAVGHFAPPQSNTIDSISTPLLPDDWIRVSPRASLPLLQALTELLSDDQFLLLVNGPECHHQRQLLHAVLIRTEQQLHSVGWLWLQRALDAAQKESLSLRSTEAVAQWGAAIVAEAGKSGNDRIQRHTGDHRHEVLSDDDDDDVLLLAPADLSVESIFDAVLEPVQEAMDAVSCWLGRERNDLLRMKASDDDETRRVAALHTLRWSGYVVTDEALFEEHVTPLRQWAESIANDIAPRVLGAEAVKCKGVKQKERLTGERLRVVQRGNVVERQKEALTGLIRSHLSSTSFSTLTQILHGVRLHAESMMEEVNETLHRLLPSADRLAGQVSGSRVSNSTSSQGAAARELIREAAQQFAATLDLVRMLTASGYDLLIAKLIKSLPSALHVATSGANKWKSGSPPSGGGSSGVEESTVARDLEALIATADAALVASSRILLTSAKRLITLLNVAVVTGQEPNPQQSPQGSEQLAELSELVHSFSDSILAEHTSEEHMDGSERKLLTSHGSHALGENKDAVDTEALMTQSMRVMHQGRLLSHMGGSHRGVPPNATAPPSHIGGDNGAVTLATAHEQHRLHEVVGVLRHRLQSTHSMTTETSSASRQHNAAAKRLIQHSIDVSALAAMYPGWTAWI